MMKDPLLTWILWKTSFTWSVIMLTEGELLLYILLSLSAVLLLWSAQLTRNFNFTNGHWFPISDIVYCLLVSRWIIPRLDVTLTSCLRLILDNVWPVPRGHEVSGHQPHPTSRVTICIGWHWAVSITNDATRDHVPQHPDGDDTQALWLWLWLSIQLFHSQLWMIISGPAPLWDGSNMCDVSQECFELKYNYADERSLSVSLNSR